MKAGELMKYTRLEIYKGISNSKLKLILGFFIVIPVIAVLSGSLISKIFITDKTSINTIQNEDKSLIVVNQSVKSDYKIYFLQAGAFMSEDNGESLRNAIKREDISPVVIQDDDIYRVIIQISDNKDLITRERDKLINLNYNCLINEFKFVSIEPSSGDETEKINKFIGTSVNIIGGLLKLTNNLPQKDSDQLENIKEYCLNLNGIYTELEKINSTTQLKNFKQRFEQYTNEYVKGYENGDEDECTKNIGQIVLLLSSYYKEIVQKYIN